MLKPGYRKKTRGEGNRKNGLSLFIKITVCTDEAPCNDKEG